MLKLSLAVLLITCTTLCTGCKPIAPPAYTLELADNLNETYSPVNFAPQGRVVLAEVFTYDE